MLQQITCILKINSHSYYGNAFVYQYDEDSVKYCLSCVVFDVIQSQLEEVRLVSGDKTKSMQLSNKQKCHDTDNVCLYHDIFDNLVHDGT